MDSKRQGFTSSTLTTGTIGTIGKRGIQKPRDPDFVVKETIRHLNATFFEFDSGNGQLALGFLRTVLTTKGRLGISDAFAAFMSQQLAEADKLIAVNPSANVRKAVKAIWMWPRKGYAPWIPVAVSDTGMERLAQEAKHVQFEIRLSEKKVYACCLDPNHSLVDAAWTAIGPELPAVQHLASSLAFDAASDSRPNLSTVEEGGPDRCPMNWSRNTESCHITMVNSDIVAALGEEEVAGFIESWHALLPPFDSGGNAPKAFGIATERVKCTFSEDWAPFSWCCVVGIRSDHITAFMASFQEHFKSKLSNQKLSISAHVTFAIVPRGFLGHMLLSSPLPYNAD